jgi:ABC-type phosphate transport system permease subunit
MFAPSLGTSENLPYSQMFDFAGWVMVVSAIFVVVLGLPTYYLLKHYDKARKQLLAFSGAVLSSMPAVIFGWPRYSPGYTSGANWHRKYVELYQDSVPTIYAWLTHLENIFLFGLHGFVGALVFYLLMCRSNEPQPALQADSAASPRVGLN